MSTTDKIGLFLKGKTYYLKPIFGDGGGCGTISFKIALNSNPNSSVTFVSGESSFFEKCACKDFGDE